MHIINKRFMLTINKQNKKKMTIAANFIADPSSHLQQKKTIE